jgi:excisionase family DNA binding protein
MSVDTPKSSRVGYCQWVGNSLQDVGEVEHVRPDETVSKLLAVEQAAERLGVKPATIRSWILKREKIETVKIGRLVRIKESSIQRLIDDNTIFPKGKET